MDVPAPPGSVDQVVGLFEKAFTRRTRVLMVSYPTFVSGLLMPIRELAELAHRKGAIMSVDGAHSLGMLDLDMAAFGVDHYTTAGQKWLMAGTGTGLAYFRKDLQDRVWTDMLAEKDPPPAGARKYERAGQHNIPSILGMGVAADFQAAIGKANIQKRVRQLATRFKTGLHAIAGANCHTPMDDARSGGLTAFSVTGVPKAALQRAAMEREHIYIVQSKLNDGSCRVSTHFYNTPDEVDRLLTVVRDVAANPAAYKA